MFLLALFVVGIQGIGLCVEPTVAGYRIQAEAFCPGAIDCFDGCDICGSAMCDLQAEAAGATPACICDFWMCYSYCAKAICEPSLVASAATQCTIAINVMEAAGLSAGCAVNCMSASALSALAALVLTFGLSW